MSDYVLVTNFWSGNITPCMDSIYLQTEQPKHWLFIDDGSPVDKILEIHECAEVIGLNASYVFAGDVKKEGNKHTIGKAWSEVIHIIKSKPADYLGIVDTDNIFPPDYFDILKTFLDNNPTVGVVSGTVKGEPRYNHMPMGGGKLVRWGIIESIDKFWNLAPDTFLNIKSLSLGYENHVIEIPVFGTKTTPRRGRDLGYRLHYCGNSIITALVKAIKLRDFALIRGFITFRLRRVEQCQDSDIRYYHSKRRIIKSLLTGKVM